MVYELDVDYVSIGDANMNATFEITKEEIQNILQLSRLQGGSKYRQMDIYRVLDRVVARKDFAEKTSLERQGVEFL